MHFDLTLWRMTQGYRWRIALSVALGLLAMVFGITRFVFLGRFLAGVFQHAPAAALIGPLAGAGIAIVLRAALDHGRTMVAHRTAMHIQQALRGLLYDKIVALGPAWFGAERTGGVMLSMVDGVEQLQTFFGQYIPQVAIAVAAPVAIFAFIAFWDVPVAAVMLAGALVTLVLPAVVHERSGRASRTRQAAFKAFGEEFLDAVQGLPTLKSFGQSKSYGAMLAAKAQALSDSTLWVLAVSVLTRCFTDVGTAGGAAAAMALGAWRVSQGDMSLTALLIVLMAGTEIFRPLRDLRTVLHQGLNGQAAAHGILTLLAAPESAPAAPTCAIPTVTLRPRIEFQNVRFAYPGGRGPAHQGLSFVVEPGERVGIVGPSGSGKSSIVRLLLRLYDPQSGSVRIDGQDLRALDPDALRRMIAVVSQDTMLFHGTIDDNLRLGRPDATEAQVVAAARAANAHDFVMALPDDYDTVIGERGAQLSGGQRARIAIARALLCDAPILVLDEALSSVDAENEAVIQQALDRLMTGRTTLILAHRLSSVIGADRILVLEDGAVAQAGRHAELIAVPGPYRDLMAPQLAEHDDVLIDEQLPTPGGLRVVETAGPAEPLVRPLSDDAAEIGWPETIRTLLGFVGPWRGQIVVTVLCGILRVVAFIGVGVWSALLLGAVRAHAPILTLTLALLLTAPLAGLLHWLESWLAHAMAYQLLAQMRIDLFRKLDALAPAYLLRRRSGDLVALATQDVETVEYFFAHTIAPSIVAGLVPAAVLVIAGVDLLASGAGPGAVPDLRRRVAGAGTAADRRAGLRGARCAGRPGRASPPRQSRAWRNWPRSTPPAAGAPPSWQLWTVIRPSGWACSRT